MIERISIFNTRNVSALKVNWILAFYRPDLIDMEKVSVQSNQENLEQAFAVAESLGVTRLLDPEGTSVDKITICPFFA